MIKRMRMKSLMVLCHLNAMDNRRFRDSADLDSQGPISRPANQADLECVYSIISTGQLGYVQGEADRCVEPAPTGLRQLDKALAGKRL